MSGTEKVILGVIGIIALSGVVTVARYVSAEWDEQERRLTAQAQRACAMKLSLARAAADSLTALSSSGWGVSCAWTLAADTTERTP